MCPRHAACEQVLASAASESMRGSGSLLFADFEPAKCMLDAAPRQSPPQRQSDVRACLFFRNFGPYHVARIAALAAQCSVLPVELCASSREYRWGAGEHESFRRITLVPSEEADRAGHAVVHRRLLQTLDRLEPDVLAVPGWWERASLAAIEWAAAAGVPVIMMSESIRNGGWQWAHREYAKRQVTRMCSAAIVGGSPHARYMQDLGMDASRVVDGYDVVDNSHFSRGAAAARNDASGTRAELGLPEQYFLASARFLPRKNLLRLIAAYDLYRRKAGAAWSLIVVGYGRQEHKIRAEVAKRTLQTLVRLVGFQPYELLPAYYGLAGAFVHPALAEPWGLVVSEAMAAGTVPIVSKTCGCAPDLVTDGETGFQFDPEDVGELSSLMLRIGSDPDLRGRLAKNAASRIEEWSPDRFARNFMYAARVALDDSSRSIPLVARACLWTLLRRAS
jgi:1,2-diacylglycerol 3-alpha-glucosyltransferase